MLSRSFQRCRLVPFWLGVLIALGSPSPAGALDPARSISDYSLTSWSDSDEALSLAPGWQPLDRRLNASSIMGANK